MDDATTAQKDTKARAKKAASDFETAFEAFNANMPSFQMPAAFRDMADQSVNQARDGYARFKAAAEEATGMAEQTYDSCRDNAMTIGLKTLEITQANTDASFAFVKELCGARSMADALEIQTAFARRQFDSFSSQFRELQDVAQKAVVETAKPTRQAMEKAFSGVSAA